MLSEKNKSTAPIIIAIHYQYLKNIASLTKSTTSNKHTIGFVGAADWLPLYFTPASAIFSETPEDTDAGIRYKQSLEFNIPGMNADDQDEMTDMVNLKVISRFEYSDGTIKIIGTDKVGAYFTDAFKSNEKSTGANWKAVCLNNKRAYFLES